MESRYFSTPDQFERLTTTEIRSQFLLDDLFALGEIKLVYTHIDRMIVGSAVPMKKTLELKAGKGLAADYFAERREIGIINIGQTGTVQVDETAYQLDYRDALYVGRGSRTLTFASAESDEPARFYLVSFPAHTEYPTTVIPRSRANQLALGSDGDSNRRIIHQYIHEDGVQSCQLVMGCTELFEGNVWNTMPAHTHERRSEVYLYFDLTDDAVVFHLMGEPHETRHIVVRNEQVAISPSWSIHAGAGTQNYCFVWAMGGENQRFDDMDAVQLSDLA